MSFGFAIWGCGAVASTHADAIKSIDGADIAGAYDLNERSRDSFCAKYVIAEGSRTIIAEKSPFWSKYPFVAWNT